VFLNALWVDAAKHPTNPILPTGAIQKAKLTFNITLAVARQIACTAARVYRSFSE
jgi:hypothetical protein